VTLILASGLPPFVTLPETDDKAGPASPQPARKPIPIKASSENERRLTEKSMSTLLPEVTECDQGKCQRESGRIPAETLAGFQHQRDFVVLRPIPQVELQAWYRQNPCHFPATDFRPPCEWIPNACSLVCEYAREFCAAGYFFYAMNRRPSSFV